MTTLLRTFVIHTGVTVALVSDLLDSACEPVAATYASLFKEYAISCNGDVWSEKSGSWKKLSKSEYGAVTLCAGGKAKSMTLNQYEIRGHAHKVQEAVEAKVSKPTKTAHPGLGAPAVVYSLRAGVSHFFAAGTSLNEVYNALHAESLSKSMQMPDDFEVYFPTTGVTRKLAVEIVKKVTLV